MTMFLGVVDPQTEQLFCVNAGHNRPYLLTPDKKVRTIGGDGSPLGSSLDTVYEPAEQHPWTPGSKLFLYSDGLIDNHIDGKELYGRKELSKQVRSLADTPAKTLLEAVLNSRDQAVKGIPQEDDISLVICTYTNKQKEGAT